MISVASRAHRILKNMPNYRDLTQDGQVPAWFPKNVEIPSDESLIGIYFEEGAAPLHAVLFTDVALHGLIGAQPVKGWMQHQQPNAGVSWSDATLSKGYDVGHHPANRGGHDDTSRLE